MADPTRRITDLSWLSAENFKFRNTEFLMNDDLHYDISDYESRAELRRQIWNVRNGDLRKVIRRFPTDKPLRVQCALWMQALVGKHFFPDANHRTAIALLRQLLMRNDMIPNDWSIERTRAARDESHAVRKQIPPIRLDTLYKPTRLYLVWWRYFVDVLDPASVKGV